MEAKRGERGKGHRQEPRRRAFVRVGNGSRGTTRGARVRRGSARPGRAGLWMGGECVPLDDGVRGHQSELLDLLGGVTRLLLPAEARLAVAPVPPSRLLARDVGLDGVLLRGVIAASSGGIVVPTGASFPSFAAAEDVHEPPLSSPPSARWEMTSSRDAVPAVPNVFPDSNRLAAGVHVFGAFADLIVIPTSATATRRAGGRGAGDCSRDRGRDGIVGGNPPAATESPKEAGGAYSGGREPDGAAHESAGAETRQARPRICRAGGRPRGFDARGGRRIRSRDPPARRGTLGDQTRPEVRGIPPEMSHLDT